MLGSFPVGGIRKHGITYLQITGANIEKFSGDTSRLLGSGGRITFKGTPQIC